MGNSQSSLLSSVCEECESNKIHDRKDLTVEIMQDWCNIFSDVFYNNTMQSKSLDLKIEITADNMEKRRLCALINAEQAEKDQELVGENYCTHGPDYDCYPSGWPSCCTNGSSCPDMKPPCGY